MIRKTDANHKIIIDQLRKIPGISVFSTHTIGKGFPDIVTGYKGLNYLFEIKDGSKVKSAQKLTEDEVKFHAKWNGQINIITTFEEAISIMGVTLR